MGRLTDASLPYVDAFTTMLSLLAQWWLNKKYLENWLLWVAADTVYLYQYAAKGLYLTTALYAVFLVMAIIGYRQWKAVDKGCNSSLSLIVNGIFDEHGEENR